MAYQIYRQYPVYCPSTDGLMGSGFEPLPNLYETLACARKVAACLADECYDVGGDDHFLVVEEGKNPRQPVRSRWDELTEEVPF